MSQDRSVVARRLMFSSAHFYKQEKFSVEENERTFGLCYTPHGHGHNYVLEAFVEGVIDPKTRLVMNLSDLDQVMKSAAKPLEHHHLNFDVPEFKTLVPTTENIALYLRNKLIEGLAKIDPKVRLHRIRLFETDDLWVEVRA